MRGNRADWNECLLLHEFHALKHVVPEKRVNKKEKSSAKHSGGLAIETKKGLYDSAEAAKNIECPLMIRSAFALGGLGSGICRDEEHLHDVVTKASSFSKKALVERSMKGWNSDVAQICLS